MSIPSKVMNNSIQSYPNTSLVKIMKKNCKYIQPKLKVIEIVYRGCIATSPLNDTSVNGPSVEGAEEKNRDIFFSEYDY